MKYRLVERNDGKFQYEHGVEDHYSVDRSGKKLILWDRCHHLVFDNEQIARKHFSEIMAFIHAIDTKKVVEEIEV